nr:prepilin peptidase [Aurantiacibacter rhizosphaerae]
MVLAAFACVAAIWDIRSRRIPNWLNLCVLVGGIIMIAVNWSTAEPLSHLMHFGLALAGAMLLFALGLWGGGDAKFYAATAIWFSLGKALTFLIVTAAAGAIVVIATGLISTAMKKKGWRKEIPYGVAIATGAIVTAFV